MYGDVTITLDIPQDGNASQKTLLVFYALPNGNTTAQTMGKKLLSGDDWHYDIQHIRAQTAFVREKMKGTRVVLAYLENSFKSWPAWKARHPDHAAEVEHIVDTVYSLFPGKRNTVCLNGHSGGGRFIFSYLDAVPAIPAYITRIVFLDSDYGYEKKYGSLFTAWLKKNKQNSLQVFAYEDSLVEVNGKRIVSDTGGTWYRTHKMLEDISADFHLQNTKDDSVIVWQDRKGRIGFYLKSNPEGKILHTTQVERNGFIHSLLAGTKYASQGYRYFGERAYEVR